MADEPTSLEDGAGRGPEANASGSGGPDRLPPEATPRPSRRCAWQIIDHEAVLLDLEGRRIQGLNSVGSFVWGLLDGARTVAELGREVAARYAIDCARAEADVARFLAEMRRRGLVDAD